MLNHYPKLLVNKLNFRRIKYTIEYIFPPKSPPSKSPRRTKTQECANKPNFREQNFRGSLFYELQSSPIDVTSRR